MSRRLLRPCPHCGRHHHTDTACGAGVGLRTEAGGDRSQVPGQVPKCAGKVRPVPAGSETSSEEPEPGLRPKNEAPLRAYSSGPSRTTRPLLLDLFCGAGGAAEGYRRAGFDVIGVDKEPQPRYPFTFFQADALDFLGSVVRSMDFPIPSRIAAIHASPVCKLWSAATPAWARANHVDYITPCRPLLEATGLPWVMECVPGAPLRPDFKICGCQVGLHELERERWFETNWATAELRSPCYHATSPITVAGHGEPSGPRMARGERAVKADWERVMGIDWMNRDELAQAIPPQYTEHVGRQLLAVLEAAA